MIVSLRSLRRRRDVEVSKEEEQLFNGRGEGSGFFVDSQYAVHRHRSSGQSGLCLEELYEAFRVDESHEVGVVHRMDNTLEEMKESWLDGEVRMA